MKILTYILFLNTFLLYSQSDSQEKIFYSYSIKNYCNFLQRAIDDSIININSLEKVHFVYKDIPKDYLPDEIDGYKIKYINLNDIKNTKLKYEKLGTVYIGPIKIENNSVHQSIYLTTITFIDNKYYFANGDFQNLIFRYSCTENKWLVVSDK